MNIQRLAAGLALCAALGPAAAADLLNVYRDSLVSDPVYQSARAQYQAGLEKLPQARAGYLPLVTGTASTFRNEVHLEIAPDQSYSNTAYAVTLTQPVLRL